VTVEGKLFPKKNAPANEPIFFYTPGNHVPEEIVINKIGKDSISGYVSIPKMTEKSASGNVSVGVGKMIERTASLSLVVKEFGGRPDSVGGDHEETRWLFRRIEHLWAIQHSTHAYRIREGACLATGTPHLPSCENLGARRKRNRAAKKSPGNMWTSKHAWKTDTTLKRV